MNAGTAAVLSLVLLALNAFFVASEFAMVAAKRHRLTERAERGSRAARSALRGLRELSLMLAGAQLGITLCTLGIGQVAEPLLEHTFQPLFSLVGVPATAGHVVAFVLGLAIVTFLHMVIGEMVPKSWVISHPEASALLMALPFRGFTWVVRPALHVLNALANLTLRIMHVRPRENLEEHTDPAQLRLLIAESGRMGLIDPSERTLLTRALESQTAPIRPLLVPRSRIAMVSSIADADTIQAVSRRTGHHRLLVHGRTRDQVVGVLHVRDAVVAQARDREITAGELARPVPRITMRTQVPEAVELLRQHHTTLAAVIEADRLVGLASLHDLINALLVGPRPVAAAAE